MKRLIELLTTSKYTIVYTGAGMSTESGLPDFRSKSRGLWKKFNPDELANINALRNNPKEFTEFYQKRLSDITKYQPHKGHFILADWEKTGIIKGIITQNVDGFHHDAGNNHVMELHGSFRSFYCHHCKRAQERKAYLKGEVYCSACSNIIRPGIILFGENLPQGTFQKAEEESLRADLFIVLGSSLTVSPANMFPLQAIENGSKLVIINHDPTPFDTFADIVIQEKSIKEVLVEVSQSI